MKTVKGKLKMKNKIKTVSRSLLKIRGIAALSLLLAVSLGACSSGEETAALPQDAETAAVSDNTEEAQAASAEDADQETPESVAQTGPEDILEYAFESFSVSDINGNEVTQDIFSDAELTMVNFWGTFCGPCINEMPDLGELSAELSEEGRVQIIGIPLDVVTLSENNEIVADDDMVAKAVEIVDQTGADYTHLIPEGEFGIYIMGSGAAQYVPSTYFVDSEGKIVGDPVVGAKDKASWQDEIENRLDRLSE